MSFAVGSFNWPLSITIAGRVSQTLIGDLVFQFIRDVLGCRNISSATVTPEEESAIRQALAKWIVRERRCLKIIEGQSEDHRRSKLERIVAIAGTSLQCYSPRSGEWSHLKDIPEPQIEYGSVIWNNSLVFVGGIRRGPISAVCAPQTPQDHP